MPTSDSQADELLRLRNTMRDQVALSALPAVWAGYAPDHIAKSLAETLLNALTLDFVYVRVRDGCSAGDVETACAEGLTADREQVRAVAETLAPWLMPGATELPPVVIDPFRRGDLRVAVARFEHTANEGVVIACSRRLDFPTEADRLLLSVGTNQMANVLERKRAEEDLSRLTTESERQRRVYETALSNTVDFNYVFDRDGRFTFVNKALLTLWRKDLADAIGKTFFELDYPPDLAARLQRQIQEVIDTQRPLRDETPYTSFDGTRAYEYIFVPVFGANGSVEAVVGSTRDITERKAIEESLREADRKKDEFISLLAHELRNPLAPIRNGLEVMRLAGADAGSAVAEVRSMMDRQLGHMVRLIDDLMDVSRINRSKMELRRARVALKDVVNAAIETSRPAIDAQEHELNVSLPQRPVFLDADLTRLAQVFSNLLTNSAKYTGRGGRIWLTAERRGAEVVVSVRDTGIGIPVESLENIFDMFSQVDRSIERSSGGLGIGLALVKGLVEMHGGTVTAASEGPGRGSTFTVTLPTMAPRMEAAIASPSGYGHAESGPRRRVLVADDNRDGADSLAMMFRLMGNEVRTAHDGVAALAQAEAFLPEIVLMDVGMPKLNGLDAARRIREKPWGKTMTIIALTGWGQDEDKERSREAGCNGHLVKPVNLADLETLLAAVPGSVI